MTGAVHRFRAAFESDSEIGSEMLLSDRMATSVLKRVLSEGIAWTTYKIRPETSGSYAYLNAVSSQLSLTPGSSVATSGVADDWALHTSDDPLPRIAVFDAGVDTGSEWFAGISIGQPTRVLRPNATTGEVFLLHFAGHGSDADFVMEIPEVYPALAPNRLSPDFGRQLSFVDAHTHRAEIKSLFELGRNELFEDGIESSLAKSLLQYLRLHGRGAVRALAYLIHEERGTSEVLAEAVRALARSGDVATYSLRRDIVERSLSSSLHAVRDAASIALVAMDDPHAIAALEAAIKVEPISDLQNDLRAVRDWLRRSR